MRGEGAIKFNGFARATKNHNRKIALIGESSGACSACLSCSLTLTYGEEDLATTATYRRCHTRKVCTLDASSLELIKRRSSRIYCNLFLAPAACGYQLEHLARTRSAIFDICKHGGGWLFRNEKEKANFPHKPTRRQAHTKNASSLTSKMGAVRRAV